MPETPTEQLASSTGWNILRMPNDSTAKTIIVALLLCFVCSVIVSTAAVALKPIQLKNKSLDKKRNILQVAGLYQEGRTVEDLFEQVETKVVDLASGDYIEEMNAQEYDQRKAAKDPEQNHIIPLDQDIAHIKHRAKRATVYLVKNGDAVKYYILPVHGYGLWSTLYGFLVLEEDVNTIYGLQFYEHAETPGLGGEVDNPNWRAKWPGKLVYSSEGVPTIEVVRGNVDLTKPEAIHHVDGLAGATLTSRGVSHLLQYWMSEQGFGPYLKQARAQRRDSL